MATSEQTAKEAQGSTKQTQTHEARTKDASVIQSVLPKEKTVATTAAEQYRKALEHAEGIKQSAVDELKKSVNAQIDELNSFGFSFRLTDGAKQSTRKRAPSDKVKHCEICNMDGHDARNHRNQDPKKKFTKAELEEKGLTPA